MHTQHSLWKVGFKALICTFFLVGCSTVKIAKEDENGIANANFRKIKVVSSEYKNYSYDIQLENLASLWESDDLKFSITFHMKPSQKAPVMPFFKSLNLSYEKDLTILSQEELEPFVYYVSFAYNLQELKEKIQADQNLIISINKGEMYVFISNAQLELLYKQLVKKGYVVDMD